MRTKPLVLAGMVLVLCFSSFISVFAADVYSPSVPEKQLLGLVNAQRISKKLPVLMLDIPLCECARKRAEDYLTTTGYPLKAPSLGMVTEQLDAASIEVVSIAQNLSRADSKKAVEGWKGKNILNKAFTHAGVGIATSDNKTMIVLLLAQIAPPLGAPSPSITPAATAAPKTTPSTTATAAPKTTPETSATAAVTPTPTSAAATRNLDGSPNAVEIETLKILNSTRVANNVPKYLIDKTLQKAAQNRAWEIADANDYKAAALSGRLSDHLTAYGVRYSSAEQCILHGRATVASALKALLNNPAQSANLVSRTYTRMGVGVALRGDAGQLIFVIYYTKV